MEKEYNEDIIIDRQVFNLNMTLSRSVVYVLIKSNQGITEEEISSIMEMKFDVDKKDTKKIMNYLLKEGLLNLEVDSENNYHYRISSKDKIVSKKVEKDSAKMELIKQVIEYLNEKAEKRFSYKSNLCKSHISARYDEGHTNIEEYKKVIDLKCMEWKNNATMETYLRPQTLFGNKFEVYLNQKNVSNFNYHGNQPKAYSQKNSLIAEISKKQNEI